MEAHKLDTTIEVLLLLLLVPAAPLHLENSAVYFAPEPNLQFTCPLDTTCVPLSLCPKMVVMLMHSNPAQLVFLQRQTCGFNQRKPYVCCANSAGQRIPLPNSCGTVRQNATQLWAVRVGFTKHNISAPEFACGGSLIAKSYVVTAAHCATANLGTGYKLSIVRFGEDPQNRRHSHESVSEDIAVEETIVHPQFDKHTFGNNVALLKLAYPVTFTDPVCLPTLLEHHFYSKPTATIVGWGATSDNPLVPKATQQQIVLPIRPLGVCRAIFSQTTQICMDHLCLGGQDNLDTCSGFGGAPLVMGLDQRKAYQVGLLSFGSKVCGQNGVPQVFVNLSAFLEWISDHVLD